MSAGTKKAPVSPGAAAAEVGTENGTMERAIVFAAEDDRTREAKSKVEI